MANGKPGKGATLGLASFMNNAATAARYSADEDGEHLDVEDCAHVLARKSESVRKGSLSALEDTLSSQATSLDCIFNTLARKAADHLENKDLFEHIATNEDGKKHKGYPHLEAAEKIMRLALKAQAQCAKTIETLANIKNPSTVAFVRQANIGQAVQVNNGATPEAVHPRTETQKAKPENELLEVSHGERLDIRAPQASIRVNQAVEAVGTVNRPEY